jgi:hypothetical protein
MMQTFNQTDQNSCFKQIVRKYTSKRRNYIYFNNNSKVGMFRITLTWSIPIQFQLRWKHKIMRPKTEVCITSRHKKSTNNFHHKIGRVTLLLQISSKWSKKQSVVCFLFHLNAMMQTFNQTDQNSCFKQIVRKYTSKWRNYIYFNNNSKVGMFRITLTWSIPIQFQLGSKHKIMRPTIGVCITSSHKKSTNNFHHKIGNKL